MTQINPRYIAYAAAHNRTHSEMLAYDSQRYPGGKMAGFIIWMSQRWSEWDKSKGHDPYWHARTELEQDEFTAWLASQYPEGGSTQ